MESVAGLTKIWLMGVSGIGLDDFAYGDNVGVVNANQLLEGLGTKLEAYDGFQ